MALSFSDFEKLRRLRRTFDLNYRVTHLFSNYLTHYPEIITKPTVDALCEDGLSVREAIGALLSVLLGLDTEREDDRVIERDYLLPSVHILKADSYYNDPYYRTVSIPDVAVGRFSFKTECYPAFRAVISDDLWADDALREVPSLGFFEEPFSFPAVLEDGNEWMTLTPVDVDTCRFAIDAAHGEVVTFGLGLGYYAFMTARKPEVTHVTVVERSADVIRLFREHLLPQFPCRDKITVIEDDAFRFAEQRLPTMGADYVFVDTWRDASDGYPMYRRMKRLEHLSEGTEFAYWIEGFLLSRMRSLRFEALYEAEAALPHGQTGDGSFEELRRQLSDEGLREYAKEHEKDTV